MEVGCTKSVKNICIVGVHQKELFLQGHAKTQLILAMHFVNMKGRKDICLEKKTSGSGSAEMIDALAVSKARNINWQYVNTLYLSKYIEEALAISR